MLKPFTTSGTPFLSVKNITLGTAGFSLMNISIFSLVNVIAFETKYLEAYFIIFFTVISPSISMGGIGTGA